MAIKRALPWLPLVVVAYVCAFALLAATLSTGLPLGIAYGVWTAAGVALTAVAGKLLFDERFTWVMAVGVGLIVAGVLLVEAGAH